MNWHEDDDTCDMLEVSEATHDTLSNKWLITTAVMIVVLGLAAGVGLLAMIWLAIKMLA